MPHSHHDNSPVRDRVVDGQRERFCKRHQGWWPLDKFVKAKQGRLGYLGYCCACRRDARVYGPSKPRGPCKARPRSKPLRSGVFACLNCRTEKPLSEFHVNRGISRGHCS
jgi:hypothetical protein